MSLTATPKGPTEIDVDWDLSLLIDSQPILTMTVTQTEWVEDLPKPNTAVSQNATSQKGQLKFKSLLPSTTYSYQLEAVWQNWNPSTPPIDRIPASTAMAVAATTPSGLTDVTDGHFIFDLVYTPVGATGPQTVNVTSNPTLSSVIPAALDPFLNQTIGSLLDNIWNNDPTSTTDPTHLRQYYSSYVADTVGKLASKAGYPINNVQVNLPTSGRVFASADSATPASADHPAKPGALVISYQLSGCTIDFDTGSVTTAFEISFDVALTITVSLPAAPPIPPTPPTPPPAQTSLVPSATVAISNASVSAENVAAALAAFFDNELSSNPFEGQIAGMADGFSESTGIAAIDTLVSQINNIGTSVIPLGFTRFSAAIVGNSIVFKITHPTDPAPVLHNLADGELDGPPPPPVLSLGQTQVKAGASGVTVVGGDFPAESVDQLSVWWINTASVPAHTGIILYYPDGTSEVMQHPSSIAASGVFEYKAAALQPHTNYVFKACCNGPLTSSAFSQPLVLLTASTAIVTLHLNGASNPTTQGPALGSASLPAVAGAWTPPPVTIPAGTAPGGYLIVAMYDGAVLASAPITVLAPGATATPVLDVVDAASTPPSVIPAPAKTIGGRGFTVQGKNFGPGPVIVMINGQAPGVSTHADAEGSFLLNLTAPGEEASEGLVSITATGLNGTASTTILELGIFMV
jgi:hypothetical protein